MYIIALRFLKKIKAKKVKSNHTKLSKIDGMVATHIGTDLVGTW